MSASTSPAAPDGAPAGDLTRAVLVGVALGTGAAVDPELDQLAPLAASAGDLAGARITARRQAPHPAL
ncbi:MAG: GTPase HflX, partial [Pseudomonadota bacterium]